MPSRPRVARFDTTAADFLADPYPTYAQMRASPDRLCALGPGVFGVSRHEDIRQLQRDPRLGSEFPAAYHALSAGTGASAQFLSRILLYREGAEHHSLRRAMGNSLNPARIRTLQDALQAMVDDVLDRAVELGDVDLAAVVGYPLPIRVACALMGVGAEQVDTVRDHAAALGGAFMFQTSAEVRAAADDAVIWLRSFLAEAVAERRRRPRDDLLSDLIAATDRDSIGHDTLVDNAVFTFFAGFETSVHMINTGLDALLNDQNAWQQLKRDPDLAPTAVEEFLRYDPPIQGNARYVKETITLGEQTVRRGRLLVLLLGSGNRDSAVFAHADTVDLARTPNPHLTFGGGAHLCLGAFLARTEGSLVFRTLARRIRSLEPTGPTVRRTSTAVRAIASLPARVVG